MADQYNSILQATLESEAVKAYQNAQATPQQVANKMTAFPSAGQTPQPSPQDVHQEAHQQAQHPSSPKMMPVKSSTIALVGYDPKGQTLHIQFKSGPTTYVYSGVDHGTFSAFMNAKSKGLFHSKNIKGTKKFPFTKVKPTPPQL
jgi:KTSC domain